MAMVPTLLFLWMAFLAIHRGSLAARTSLGFGSRGLLQQTATINASSGSWSAHQCLWTPPSPAAAATATAVAAAQGPVTATAVASASSQVPSGPSCSLNPSYFFSLTAPAQDGEKLLLKVTAMRYICLNHTSETACGSDQDNWCVWQEDKARCELSFGDADFASFLLWSGTKIACNGSLVAQIVNCSYAVSAEDCSRKQGCDWTEAACYPTSYGALVAKPKQLYRVKHQIHLGDPEVWGICAGADLYRRYSSICSHSTPEQCAADPAGCQYLPEFESEVQYQVASNPLNFTKACVLSSARFPLESVFLGGSNSAFSAVILNAQQGCTGAHSEVSCTANTTLLSSDVLGSAMQYSAATVPSTNTTGGTSGPTTGNEGNAGGQPFTASWGISWGGVLRPSSTQTPRPSVPLNQPAVPAAQGPDANAASVPAPSAPSPAMPAPADVPVDSVAASSVATAGAVSGSSTAIVSSSSASSRDGTATAVATAGSSTSLKGIAHALDKSPVQVSEFLAGNSNWSPGTTFHIAEGAYGVDTCTLPGTCRASCFSLIALRVKKSAKCW